MVYGVMCMVSKSFFQLLLRKNELLPKNNYINAAFVNIANYFGGLCMLINQM